MKTILLCLFVSLAVTLNAQLFSKKEQKRILLTSSALLLSGSMDGTSETLKFKYNSFKTIFPYCNNQYWNPDLNWRNKWKSGDPTKGEKFPLSSTVFVFTTELCFK